MSAITSIEIRGMLESYQAVYNDDLREELEEEREVEWVGVQIIENAAYVLFSQGYDVDDVISYFTEASREVIVEDAISISEGVLLVESVAVSDEYIAEQFELLYERVPGLGWLASQAGRAANAVKGAVTSVKKSAETYNRAKNIQKIRDVKTAVPPGKAKVTTGSGGTPPTGTAKVTTTGGNAVGRNVFQKAGDFAKKQLMKIPGAGTVAKIAKSPVGKIAGKALPGLGAAAYGIDAADRAKKGDWGGAALSGLGAVTSAIPGAGLVAGLAPAAIQAGTDALGLTGDKSKKGSAKPTPAGPPSLKAKQDFAKSKGKYYSSSDQKTYKNYNDALAAKNSRRGIKPTATPPPKPPTGTPPTKTNTPTATKTAATSPAAAAPRPTATAAAPKPAAAPAPAGPKPTATITPTPAAPKPEEGERALTKLPGGNYSSDATSMMSQRTKNILGTTKTPAARPMGSARERMLRQSFDPYDVIKGHLLDEGYADTEEAALAIMINMSEEWRQSIIQ
jgi:hypothetical protein